MKANANFPSPSQYTHLIYNSHVVLIFTWQLGLQVTDYAAIKLSMYKWILRVRAEQSIMYRPGNSMITSCQYDHQWHCWFLAASPLTYAWWVATSDSLPESIYFSKKTIGFIITIQQIFIILPQIYLLYIYWKLLEIQWVTKLVNHKVFFLKEWFAKKKKASWFLPVSKELTEM